MITFAALFLTVLHNPSIADVIETARTIRVESVWVMLSFSVESVAKACGLGIVLFVEFVWLARRCHPGYCRDSENMKQIEEA